MIQVENVKAAMEYYASVFGLQPVWWSADKVRNSLLHSPQVTFQSIVSLHSRHLLSGIGAMPLTILREMKKIARLAIFRIHLKLVRPIAPILWYSIEIQRFHTNK